MLSNKHTITPQGQKVLDLCAAVKALLAARKEEEVKLSKKEDTKETSVDQLIKDIDQIDSNVNTGLYFANQLDAGIMYKDYTERLDDMRAAVQSTKAPADVYTEWCKLQTARYRELIAGDS
ncbi:MAG: hypothetical protein KGL39_13155 [Patescibacteria group bacterium]|nr:hypothetical protein [Patescibacteria group bacterium]